MTKVKRFTTLTAIVLAIATLSSIFSVTASAATTSEGFVEVSPTKAVTLYNQKTKQYTNYDFGTCKNGQPLRCWPWDGSIEQKFNIIALSNGSYRIVTNKNTSFAIDVYRGNNKLKAGQLLDIWKSGDDSIAQNIKFYRCSDGSYILVLASDTSLAIASNGSKGQLKLVKFNKSDSAQKWVFQNASKKNIEIRKTTVSSKATSTVATVSNGTTQVNWDTLVGKTLANIKTGSEYGKFYNSKNNISAKGGYYGQCTWYCLGRFTEVNGINLGKAPHAKYWLSTNKDNSKVKILDKKAKIPEKSIAVDIHGEYGHVLFVEHVDYDVKGNVKTVYFTECNWDNNHKYDAGKDCILKKLSYKDFLSEKSPDGYIVAK